MAREKRPGRYTEWSKTHIGADEAGIFDAQSLFLEDPELLGAVSRMVLEDRAGAESAWQVETTKLVDRLAALDDPYLRARAADVADVAARVMRRLTRAKPQAHAFCANRRSFSAQRSDAFRSEGSRPGNGPGLCLEAGSASAHSVILARAMGIPVVAGLGPGVSALADGTIVAVDGAQGTVWISP